MTGQAVTITASAAAGQCDLVINAPGRYAITASYDVMDSDKHFNGSAGTAAHAVGAGTVSLRLTGINPMAPEVFQAVQFSFEVSPVSPAKGSPDGTVTIRVSPVIGADASGEPAAEAMAGAQACSAKATQGTCSLSFSASGNYQVVMTYAGDSNFSLPAPVTDQLTVAVTKRAPSMRITGVDTSSVSAGQSVVVSFEVTSPNGRDQPPSGTVTVQVVNGEENCSADASDGKCTLTFKTGGAKQLVASYAGDDFTVASESAPYEIQPAPTTEFKVFLPITIR